MFGDLADIQKLRDMGVQGMKFRSAQFPFFRRVFIWICGFLGYSTWHGYIEHCICSEGVLETLRNEWPKFHPGSFTAKCFPYRQCDQLPKEQQKAWNMRDDKYFGVNGVIIKTGQNHA